MRERRFDPRHALKARAAIAWEDDQGQLSRSEGVLDDLSYSGAKLTLSHGINLFRPVALVAGGKELKGVVQYCRRGAAGYVIGIELDEESRGVVSARAFSKQPVER